MTREIPREFEAWLEAEDEAERAAGHTPHRGRRLLAAIEAQQREAASSNDAPPRHTDVEHTPDKP